MKDKVKDMVAATVKEDFVAFKEGFNKILGRKIADKFKGTGK